MFISSLKLVLEYLPLQILLILFTALSLILISIVRVFIMNNDNKLYKFSIKNFNLEEFSLLKFNIIKINLLKTDSSSCNYCKNILLNNSVLMEIKKDEIKSIEFNKNYIKIDFENFLISLNKILIMNLYLRNKVFYIDLIYKMNQEDFHFCSDCMKSSFGILNLKFW